MSKPNRRDRNRRGLTLVEMMIAMVVLSIGLLGVAGLQQSVVYAVNGTVAIISWRRHAMGMRLGAARHPWPAVHLG